MRLKQFDDFDLTDRDAPPLTLRQFYPTDCVRVPTASQWHGGLFAAFCGVMCDLLMALLNLARCVYMNYI